MTNDDPSTTPGAILAGQEFFDANWYRATYPDTAGTDPWQHFVDFGDGERRSPGPGFDANFYASTYLPLEAGGALRHYLEEGREAGFLPLPREYSASESRDAMRQALAGLSNPVVLIGNDAQQAGAPLLLLEIARHLRARGYSPVILLLRAGPLLPAYTAVGPTLILAEGYDIAGLGHALAPETFVVGNTALSAPVRVALGSDLPGGILVHEMPEFLMREGLIEDVGRSPLVVASFPNIASGLIGRLPRSRVVSIQPGLLHVSVGPQSTARVRDRISASLGSSHPIFLGAGYADSRKGFDRFVAAAQAIRAREPAAGFIWLGELSAWARGIADSAIADGLPLMLPGFRADAAAWYDNADVYLLTSRQDPGPTTAVDAARRGMPFVAAPGDLGLQSLRSVFEEVGTFCETDDELAGRALEVAQGETDAARDRRASVIEQYASFPRYVDDLLEALHP
ncbi:MULTISPECIES: glycosyltransferase [unclassified Leucobacter]|uniref:glycosyltransferase n=1 Tax=unclassified Leucobacter TaxID=2621730 RepID=UPI00165D6336|nr:glycosyltransferase [Leucobacter sp. CX169]MBC9927161.1 glycosyltransferase [Leucobacter sp. cx-169]